VKEQVAADEADVKSVKSKEEGASDAVEGDVLIGEAGEDQCEEGKVEAEVDGETKDEHIQNSKVANLLENEHTPTATDQVEAALDASPTTEL